MGWNILPLTPERNRMGVNTKRMMTWPKNAECIMLPAALPVSRLTVACDMPLLP